MGEMVASMLVIDPAALLAQLRQLNDKVDRLLAEHEAAADMDGVDPGNMTTAQTAKYLKVSRGFLNKSRMPSSKTVGPPYHRNGKKVYYTKADLDEWRRSTKKECKRQMTPMERRLAAVKEAG